ncbi:hypothetical protein [Fundidesulfovibrio soli]|uniref:hypothetical protein n=1 Tax=Fundidesulfovibrio soli TaxID=2922716 RepID=UPI001FAEA34B|nr:hypothetical protein [Fundidesulfovibrio soli]
MLKCYDQKDDKLKRSNGTRKSTGQLSLWGGSIKPFTKSAEDLAAHSLKDISIQWTGQVKNLDLSELKALKDKCGAISDSLSKGVAEVHGKIRNKGLSHPADVAAYLVLRDLDDKGIKEVPNQRLRVIYFGVKALSVNILMRVLIEVGHHVKH